MDITSEEFFTKLKKRNTEAFHRLYEEFKVPLFSLIFAIIKDRDRTADIIQETFIKVIKNIQQLEDIKKIKYWIFRIAVNLTMNILKRDKRLSYAGDDLEAIADQFVGEEYPRYKDEGFEELYYNVSLEVARLPLKHRVVFIMKYIRNLKETEIAEILGIPVGTVKSRLNVARNKIKNSIENSNNA